MSYALSFPQPPSEVKFYFGPKDFDQLQRSDQQLVRTINFGWFAWLVVPLLRALKWVNGFVGNYGWSIIVLTILINIAIFPLRHKSVVSMRKMQDIQPRVKAIQERYAHLKATDPARQKMNTEMMELYKTAGVNPASGCVPMLLTMPVLFAFYALLSVAIELRGAPFMLWIQDLSQHDPLYITPIIMGATMLWQQWITPAAGMDPAQQRVMMIMPLMFTFFFLWAPSGLVVYWLFSNLLTIGQQYLTNRIVGRAAREAGARLIREQQPMTTQASLHEQIGEFVRNVVTAMGVTVTVTSEVTADGIRVDISGEEGELLVRRKGEALDALQHLVNSIWRDQTRPRRPHRRRLPGLPEGQGRRTAADGQVHDREGQDDADAAGDGPAQLLLAPPGAPRGVADPECVESQGDGLVKTIIISPR